jgi:hypothetical protein
VAAEGLLGRPDDRFANLAGKKIVESAANTLTFGEVDFGIGLGSGVGLLIDQIDYYFDPASNAGVFVANLDAFRVGWCSRDTITTLADAYADPSVIHLSTMQQVFTTSGLAYLMMPLVHKFTPPIIVGTNRGKLYLAVQGVSAGGAVTIQSRIYFRYIPLKAQDYLELAEAFNLMG